MSAPDFSLTDVTWPARLGTPSAIALHATQHLRTLLTFRRLWPYLLLAALPVAASAGLARLSLNDTSAVGTFYHHFAMRALALCALGLGTSALREDIDAGALPLLLLKPRAAVALPIGRMLAVALLIGGLGAAMMAGSTLSLLGTPFSPDAGYLLRQMLAAVFGAFAYTGIFMAFGTLAKAGTAMGLGFMVAVDLLLCQWVDLAAKLSPSTYVGILVQTLPGRDLTAANTAEQIPGALLALVLLGAAGCAGTLLRLRGDAPQ